jgi:hypothetical protein
MDELEIYRAYLAARTAAEQLLIAYCEHLGKGRAYVIRDEAHRLTTARREVAALNARMADLLSAETYAWKGEE